MKLGITGIGIVSPLGSGKKVNWQRLINSESEVRYNKNFDTFTAHVNDFKIPNCQRQYEMAKSAVLEAINEASIKNSIDEKCKVGVCIGESKINLFNDVLPFENSLSERFGNFFKFYDNTTTVSAACATGILTIIEGCKLIKTGECDAVVCGSSETSIHPLYVAGFKNIGVLTKHGPSPFDIDRDGFAIGEGACFVIIENMEKALIRQVKVYCEISGFASGIYSDDTISVSSHVRMKNIIKKTPNLEIPDYIHTHGTGTKLNDYNESMAIKESFENTNEISLSSTKAATGHMLGVSGMIGTVFSILAMKNNIVPPTLNFQQTDINLDLDYTPNVAKKRDINSALVLSFGFGGQGAALLLKK